MEHYIVLGISPDASMEDATIAYKRLVRQHHPDRGGSVEHFQRIVAAYEWMRHPATTPVPHPYASHHDVMTRFGHNA